MVLSHFKGVIMEITKIEEAETLESYINRCLINNCGICLLFNWNSVAVDLFVEQANKVKAGVLPPRPNWLNQWPMSPESLRNNIISVLKGKGEHKSFGLNLVGPNTPVEFWRITRMVERIETARMVERIETDPYMQDVMKAVLQRKPGAGRLAKLVIIRDKTNLKGDSTGVYPLPTSFVHLFE